MNEEHKQQQVSQQPEEEKKQTGNRLSITSPIKTAQRFMRMMTGDFSDEMQRR